MTVNTHAINQMRNLIGYTITQASLFIMNMTGSQVAGVLLGEYRGNKFEKRLVAASCMLLHARALFVLTYATHALELIFFALGHGLAWGIRSPFMQAIRADYFGRKSIEMIRGISASIAAIGETVGPLIAGCLGNVTGDY